MNRRSRQRVDPTAARELLRREFPSLAHLWDDRGSRRELLRVMGASLALAGFGACGRDPAERILPAGSAPRDAPPGTPGRPLDFATAMPRGGGALGLLVRTREGRPIKLEGNPDHPASDGASDALAQAAVLTLYDPERSRVVTRERRVATWRELSLELSDEIARLDGGEGLRVLTGAVLSPTLHAQLEALLAALPRARVHRYEPVGRDAERAGALAAYGRDVAVQLHLDRAEVVVALDADLVGLGPDAVRHAREVGRRRTTTGGAQRRLFAIESTPSLTGAFADHRLRLRPSDVERAARMLARELGVPGAGRELPEAALGAAAARLVRAAAAELAKHPGRGAVACGVWASPATHALAHAINARLGNVGAAVELTEPLELLPRGPATSRDTDDAGDDHGSSLAALVDDARAGRVRVLAILGGNPVYDAPADVDFAAALAKVRCAVHLGAYADETAAACRWHLPEAHFLEAWGDALGPDGTATILQPAIAPLHDGRTAHELVAALAGRAGASAYDLVRGHWRTNGPADDGEFERYWRRAVHDGVVPDTRRAAIAPTLRDPIELPPPEAATGALELCFRPDASAWDGRFANNAWLQELPRPLTRLVWDNAAHVAPGLARQLGVETGDVVELRVGDRTARAPVLVQPGHPDGAVTVHLGYGRTAGGEVGRGVGFDAYALRTRAAPWMRTGLRVTPLHERRRLVTVQEHRRIDAHASPARRTTRAALARQEGRVAGHSEHASLYPDRTDPEEIAWGMVIDLSACTGCNACMTACQAENNVPVVGREEVANGREMHWIRVDVYDTAEGDGDPETVHQPVPCMHCEQAPCEVVCPVGATVHTSEGLNAMIYNRCVGTRYCANNCPYKVRRFNFHDYVERGSELLALGRNPEVTVRGRGVMEKCTYCVQRIEAARTDAAVEGTELRPADVVTACQQACPTRAIAFGDLRDGGSEVARRRGLARHYALLGELGTRPRTTYLARVDDPSLELEHG